ncbi:MAG: hypothetical protein G01um101466_752 [Parcubacteria group bacterium Gr01-1014_66]|nr:MAG: hypothetical protein G01um101466_752 [Parcubacteria group bacterium Gr01-1014_66]
MSRFIKGCVVGGLLCVLLTGGWFWIWRSSAQEDGTTSVSQLMLSEQVSVSEKPVKSIEERIVGAQEKSSKIKAVYMTAPIANDQGPGAARLRQQLIQLAETTEINGIVIDVKEVCGPEFNPVHLKKLIAELREKNIWAIARIVVFKDASQTAAHPEWYLTRSNRNTAGDECARKRYLRVSGTSDPEQINFWQDKKGGYWLDPASTDVRAYIASHAKTIIDLGFDELQFDYIRFPSDGDVAQAIYPAWDGKTPKYTVMRDFSSFLSDALKTHKPEIILSADLFGYTALRAGDVGIGQRLDDIGNAFDYISFMVYPSHYYSGFVVPMDHARGLPALHYTVAQARTHPDAVVERSLYSAQDFLDSRIGTSTLATSTTRRVRLRPWLEDFFHEEDRLAHRPFGAQKVRMQIEGAERATPHGWILWNSANLYTADALKKE